MGIFSLLLNGWLTSLRLAPVQWLLQLAMAAVFLYSAQDKLRHRQQALVEVREGGLPWLGLILDGTIAIQMLGGLALISGWPTAVAAGASTLAIFTLLASLMFHRFWLVRGEVRQHQLTAFLEHLLMVAGLLVLAAQQEIRPL